MIKLRANQIWRVKSDDRAYIRIFNRNGKLWFEWFKNGRPSIIREIISIEGLTNYLNNGEYQLDEVYLVQELMNKYED